MGLCGGRAVVQVVHPLLALELLGGLTGPTATSLEGLSRRRDGTRILLRASHAATCETPDNAASRKE